MSIPPTSLGKPFYTAASAVKAEQKVSAPQIAPVSEDAFVYASQSSKQSASTHTAASSIVSFSKPISLKKLLKKAAIKGDVGEIQRLKALKVDVNAKDNIGQTAMHHAAIFGQDEALTTLKALGAYINAEDNYGRTPLHYAASEGQNSTIRKLAALGANIEARENFGGTPLHEAASNNQIEAINTLLELDANVLATDRNGAIPLHDAAINRQAEAVETLARYQSKTLKNKGSIDTEDNFGNTPYDEVCKQLKEDDLDGPTRQHLINLTDTLWMYAHPGYMRLSASDFTS